MQRAVFAVILLGTTLPLFAALSPRYADWPNGPVQWLMTPEDRRDWKAVSTDAEAETFIDLFWARRDPTPGTRLNELRRDFENRASEADRLFGALGKRGSLTQPGRVYILLGAPDYQNASLPLTGSGIESSASFDRDGNVKVTDLGHPFRMIYFDYEMPIRHGLMSRFVSFTMSPTTHEYEMVIERNNATGALDRAVRGAIFNASLNSVPSWAVDLSAGRTLPPGEGQPFRIFLAIASTAVSPDSNELLPADVQKAISDLKGFLPYKSYRTIDSRLFRCRSGRPWSVELEGYGRKTYLVSIAYNPVDGGKLNVYKFNVARADAPTEPILSTSFSLGVGETISVGSSKVKETDDALVFFVTALGK